MQTGGIIRTPQLILLSLSLPLSPLSSRGRRMPPESSRQRSRTRRWSESSEGIRVRVVLLPVEWLAELRLTIRIAVADFLYEEQDLPIPSERDSYSAGPPVPQGVHIPLPSQ